MPFITPNNCPYACHIYTIRWGKSGTIACTYEADGRLFSCHRTVTGAIAAICGADGNGSVMDEVGRCLFSLKPNSAMVIADNGEAELELTRREPPSSTEDKEAEQPVHIISFAGGSCRIEAKKIKLKDWSKSSGNDVNSCTLQWIFSGLTIDFNIRNWEVVCFMHSVLYVYCVLIFPLDFVR
jgi:hypothetical protein